MADMWSTPGYCLINKYIIQYSVFPKSFLRANKWSPINSTVLYFRRQKTSTGRNIGRRSYSLITYWVRPRGPCGICWCTMSLTSAQCTRSTDTAARSWNISNSISSPSIHRLVHIRNILARHMRVQKKGVQTPIDKYFWLSKVRHILLLRLLKKFSIGSAVRKYWISGFFRKNT